MRFIPHSGLVVCQCAPILFLGLTAILFSCQETGNNSKTLSQAALTENYPVDTLKEQMMLRIGEEFIHAATYDIKEDASDSENKEVLKRMSNNINIPDSLLLFKFIAVNTKNGDFLDKLGENISASIYRETSLNVGQIPTNGLHLEFHYHEVYHLEVEPVVRNGITYTRAIKLKIITKRETSDRNLWLTVIMLYK